jgi:hypothetical protein
MRINEDRFRPIVNHVSERKRSTERGSVDLIRSATSKYALRPGLVKIFAEGHFSRTSRRLKKLARLDT